MSTRRMLNTALGAVALLLFACIAIVWNQGRVGGGNDVQIQLALRQQALIQDLSRNVEDLAAAEDLAQVAEARKTLGKNVLQYDQNLAALYYGGNLDQPDGTRIQVPKATGARSRAALDQAAKTWIETGKPLADLAAGEFSTFSAAGRQAIEGLQENNLLLMQHMGSLATVLREGAAARQALSRTALWASGGFALLLLALVGARFHPKFAARRAQARSQEHSSGSSGGSPAEAPLEARAREQSWSHAAPLGSESGTESGPGRGQAFPHARAGGAARGSELPVPLDFVSVGASVDQISIDMNTIASSTDKMRSAIDSVGQALQGMLDSLTEMAQDTAEGGKIVRGANNAAGFTSEAATDLAAAAREMSQVVGRVTQLALRTKQIAAQIDAEAVDTGRTGSAFTSVVAGEVKGLARQTAEATARIEDTVAEILTSARRHEEAIGQIIKNIAAINKVSQNLGKLMTCPPPRVVPASAPTGAPIGASAGAAAGVAVEPVAESRGDPSPAAQPVGMPIATGVETHGDDAMIAAAFAVESEDQDEQAAQETVPDGSFTLDDDFLDPVPDLEAVAEETRGAIAEIALGAAAPQAQTDPCATVFMLGKNKEAAAVPQDVPPAVAALSPESAVVAPAVPLDPVPGSVRDHAPAASSQDAADAAATTAPSSPGFAATGSSANVFMLNKPKKPAARKEPDPNTTTPSPIGTALTAQAAPTGRAEPAAADGITANVFSLDGTP